ncbi:YbaB/EbfC family nucleoid-associated protein [Stackebrandtia soli]|uniref:YbaB/EbfC family nucleoid-associated protein n=1 Tax=Stackebrandtia soli TaxID=1892856 RepID=UPI0039E9197C
MSTARGGPESWVHQTRVAYDTFLRTLSQASDEARDLEVVGPSSDGGVRARYRGDYRVQGIQIHPKAYETYTEQALAAQVVSAINSAKKMLGQAQRRYVNAQFKPDARAQRPSNRGNQ